MQKLNFEPGAPVGDDGIPLCVPEIRGNAWSYIKECLDTNFVSSVGPFVDRFESELAGRVGARYAVATASGTAALHVALLVAGVEPQDEVLVSTLTFIAPVNAIRYANAWPVFIDAESKHWEMDAAKVVDFLEKECQWQAGELRNRHTGRRVRAIMPVHILGHPVDMDPILEAARKYNLPVIEDATESLGATYKGRTTGRIGDIACFSFNGNKIITTGGGGMIVTDNEEWARKAKYLTTQAKDDPFEFIHNEVGFNYRLTNLQAALGCAQLELLDEFIAAKRRIAGVYSQALAEVPGLTLMQEAEWAFSIYWMYTVLVDPDRFGMDSRALMRKLAERNIQARPLWQPAHLSPAHRDAYAVDCSVAERLNRQAVSLPCSVGLTSSQQEQVLEMLTT
ncbi:MAG TPA: LegC family aminotransferase [Anaerolineales bacterium]|nr:LegC family aminotransferase [Anaerolineales bacterium]